jgi:hypothetical protein
MPLAQLVPAIPASERPQTYGLNGAATGIFGFCTKAIIRLNHKKRTMMALVQKRTVGIYCKRVCLPVNKELC